MAREEKDIWLDKGVFRQQVRLAAAQVSSLSKGELEFALAYEVEPFSGIPADEADIVWREIEEEDAAVKAFEVAVIGRKSKSGKSSKSKSGASKALCVLIILALAAVVAAVFDYVKLDGKLKITKEKVDEQLRLDSQIKSVVSRSIALEQEREKIRSVRQSAEKAQAKIANLRSAYQIAMEMLASVCGGRTVVKSFASPEPFSIELVAVAVSAQNAAETMARLSGEAKSKGWRLEMGEISSSSKSPTVQFVCRLYFEGERE
ncbi:MAG: hypothetical protein IJQ34_02635 [Kiritimatiellae bacterium]|nr:hypothetical protein [Kiritimatiellia bacterium]